jgi:hypothetical protein
MILYIEQLKTNLQNNNYEWIDFYLSDVYIQNVYQYINGWKSGQRMNLLDVGSETSVNDSVQANKNDKYTYKVL